MSSEIKHLALWLCVKSKNHCNTSAAKTDHWRCFEVSLRNVGLEVPLAVKLVSVQTFSDLLPQLHVSFCLNQLSKDKIVQHCAEDLGHVGRFRENLGEHSTGSGDHPVWCENRRADTVNLMCCHLTASLIASVDDIVLEQWCVVCNFDACWETHYLVPQIDCKVLVWYQSPGKKEKNCRSEVFPFQV